MFSVEACQPPTCCEESLINNVKHKGCDATTCTPMYNLVGIISLIQCKTFEVQCNYMYNCICIHVILYNLLYNVKHLECNATTCIICIYIIQF